MKNTIKKNKEGYGYKYTELAEINKYCLENDITYWQETETSEINQQDYIITFLNQNGEITKHRGCQIVKAVLSGIKNPVQEYGSSLTYCRRYSLLMALGLATEDTDAQELTVVKEVTEEDASNWTFQFGKKKGQKMTDVINEDLQYVEWFINNKANEYDKKCYELLTGVKTPTHEENNKRLTLYNEISKIANEKNVLPNEIFEHFNKSRDEMNFDELEEVIKWLEEEK